MVLNNQPSLVQSTKKIIVEKTTKELEEAKNENENNRKVI